MIDTAGIGSAISMKAEDGFEPSAAKSASKAPFEGLFQEAVGQIDHLETQARGAVDGLMTGTGVDVHQAMIATQKVSMAFELALAVRNKAVQAYQSVMSLQF
ncbi:MAG TPA: flagellar hook-basal body complex protein FliE [Terracidiphilus sp.]|jgi:flagellar hook-basal body complex protein FliE|nr:flagellar hook-basal body complex protein FliE [Terracidiphilus sp.]